MWRKRAEWLTDKYILVMLGVFPLFWGFHGYARITASKFYFFAILTGVWVVSVVTLLVIGGVKGEEYWPIIRPAHVAMAVFLATGAISAAASEYGGQCLLGTGRFDGYLTTVLYGLIFYGVSWLGKPRRRYPWALALSVTALSVISFLQLLGLDPFGLYPDGTNYYDKYVAYGGAFLGTIGNVGIVAAYLCLAVPFMTVYALLSEERYDRLLLIPAVLGLVTMAGCDVMAGYVALAGCVLVGVPVVIRGRRARRLAAGVSAGVSAAGLTALYFWPGESGTLWEFSQVLHGNLADEFGSRRGEIWKRAWELFLEKPWLGGGPGTAAARFQIHWVGEYRNASVDNAHNVYLGHLINTGLLSALSYLGAAVCSFVTWVRRRDRGPLYPALGCGVLCCMVQDFFGLGLHITAPMLFVAWGLLESVNE